MRASRHASPSLPAYTPGAPDSSSARADEPLVPATYDVNQLRAAVGASPLVAGGTDGRQRPTRDDDDDDLPRPRSRRAVLVAAASVVVGVAVASFAVLGHLNSGRYLLACEAERAVPEQGRGFPPWGTRPLDGEAWKPLKISAETRCQPRETDDVLVLERLYLAMVIEQATALLTAREVTQLDDADAMLKQGLLLTRPRAAEPAQLAGERNDRHQQVERLLGDVGYWRARAKLRDAAAALAEAARQLDAAAAHKPRHVSDAAAWGNHARKLADQLQAGPAGSAAAPAAAALPAPAAASGTTAREPATTPAGVELPIEPARPSTDGQAPASASVPTGGVLL